MSTYREDLLSDLKNPAYAAEYLTAARRESRGAFLLALRDVVEAQKGMARVASEAGVNRENLYRMLSDEGNPRLTSLDSVLETLGIEAHFVPKADPGIGILASIIDPEPIVQAFSSQRELSAADIQARATYDTVLQGDNALLFMATPIAVANPAEGANSWPMKAMNLNLVQMNTLERKTSLPLTPTTSAFNPIYGTSEFSSVRS